MTTYRSDGHGKGYLHLVQISRSSNVIEPLSSPAARFARISALFFHPGRSPPFVEGLRVSAGLFVRLRASFGWTRRELDCNVGHWKAAVPTESWDSSGPTSETRF